jgi:hypothetical protein
VVWGFPFKRLVTLSAAKGLDNMLKRFFAALRMTEGILEIYLDQFRNTWKIQRIMQWITDNG